MNQDHIVNTEIRALLMLMLLKGGTRAEEIQTALQMAAVSRLNVGDDDFASAPQASAPRAPADPTPDSRLHHLSPKQVVRNSYLAPIKGYAA